jgi:hypothetical protein
MIRRQRPDVIFIWERVIARVREADQAVRRNANVSRTSAVATAMNCAG